MIVMNWLNNIIKYLQSLDYRLSVNSYFKFYDRMDDETYLKFFFRKKMNQELDLSDPKTFNEKLQWLKLYDRSPIYTKMVDKYEVKDYVSKIIGNDFVIPTLGVYDKFDDIDFEKLPNQFVLKCTHDSGGLVICKDKKTLDIKAVRNSINKSLRRDYYKSGREWPYKNVPKKIIAEEYMKNADGSNLLDYKFFCFNGNPKMILVCLDRFSKNGMRENFYDTDWNLLPLCRPKHPNTDYEVLPPKNLSEMVAIAHSLSQNTKFSRIDLYEINGKIYFGEITFFPASGFEMFQPKEWDYKLGEWLNLDNK